MKAPNLYKHQEFGHVYVNDPLVTPVGMFEWPYLTKPKKAREVKDSQVKSVDKYEITILLPKDNELVKLWVTETVLIIKAASDLFNQGKPNELSIKAVVQDGDAFTPEYLQKYPYYAGNWVLVARNPTAPSVYNLKREDLPSTDIRAGMKGRLVIYPYIVAQGLRYRLEAVQLTKDDGVRHASGGKPEAKNFLTDLEEETVATETIPPVPPQGAATAVTATKAASVPEGSASIRAALAKI